MKIDYLEGCYNSISDLNNKHPADNEIVGLVGCENKVNSLSIEDLNIYPKTYVPWTQTKKLAV